jgi:type III secretion protein R
VSFENYDPVSLAMLLAAMGLVPLLLMMCTCFLKIAVVLQLVRNAMGVQQVPPNMVLYGIAASLTIFIMAPVFSETQKIVAAMDTSEMETKGITYIVKEASGPLKLFMERNTRPAVLASFRDSAEAIWKGQLKDSVLDENFLILIPAFVVSELQTGFEIGFIIYLPFVVIDLITSNILLALGMQMVAPMTVSLPLKILLFVVLSGWEKLFNSLILSYF